MGEHVSAGQHFIPAGSKFGQFGGDQGSIPEGAVPLSRADMMEVMYHEATRWKPRSDMWSFTYGTGFVGGMAGLTGILANGHYRMKMKLLNLGRTASFVPVAVIPIISVALAHNIMVTQPILVQEMNCPTCAEVRSVFIQVGFGFIQPMCLAVFGSMLQARYKYTVALPDIRNVKANIDYFTKITKPFRLTLTLLLAANIITASVIAHEEMKASIRVAKAVLEGGHFNVKKSRSQDSHLETKEL